MKVQDAWALNHLIRAFDLIKGYDEAEVREQYDEYMYTQRYLQAEAGWKTRVRAWLAAKRKWELSQEKFGDPVYAAAKRGWDGMKAFVPNLDGVQEFDRLPEALQFRYASFAAAVLNQETPTEVKSSKQVAREIAAQSEETDDDDDYPYDCCSDCG